MRSATVDRWADAVCAPVVRTSTACSYVGRGVDQGARLDGRGTAAMVQPSAFTGSFVLMAGAEDG